MQRNVLIQPLDEDTLLQLRDVAVADADPAEVLPPMEGPPGWTAEKELAFVGFFGPMLSAADVTIYAITVDGRIAGFTRLTRLDERTGQTGIWLGRSWRGQGVGIAALGELLKTAARAGLARVVADTTPTNTAAQALLRTHGARLTPQEDKIYAEMATDPAYAIDLDK